MYDYSDIRVVSADYLKLQNVSLYWLLPQEWLKGWGVKRLELNVSASSLFTYMRQQGLKDRLRHREGSPQSNFLTAPDFLADSISHFKTLLQ